jgi:hypothetical protein
MEFALLIYANEKSWESAGEEERRATYAEHERFTKMLEDRGAVRGGAELAFTTSARTLRHNGGELSVTDGPFAETAEQLGGFYLVEAASLDEALELARHLPAGVVEVRPIVPMPDGGS